MIIKSILDTDLYKFTTMNSSQPIFGCVKLSDDAGKHTGKIEDV